MQTITRKGSFDAMHRVVNHKSKCANIHGHTYLYELTFSFTWTEGIGFQADFADIKKIFCEWIDRSFDHGAIINPQDLEMRLAIAAVGSKSWEMSLCGKEGFCNPTCEMIAREIFIGIDHLTHFFFGRGLKLVNVRLWETPNVFTDCTKESISAEEKANFLLVHRVALNQFGDEIAQSK